MFIAVGVLTESGKIAVCVCMYDYLIENHVFILDFCAFLSITQTLLSYYQCVLKALLERDHSHI